MTNTTIVGFGGAARAGKDVSARAITTAFGRQYDIRQYAFATPLKVEMYDALLNPRDAYWDRRNYLILPHPRSHEIFLNDSDKVAWIDRHKEELRADLQYYGSEYRRAANPFYWIKKMAETISRDSPKVALITDVRFPNEHAFVAGNNGFLVKVIRLGYQNPEGVGAHVSETALDRHKWHFEITVNDGDVAELEKDAVWVFNRIIEAVGGEAYAQSQADAA